MESLEATLQDVVRIFDGEVDYADYLPGSTDLAVRYIEHDNKREVFKAVSKKKKRDTSEVRLIALACCGIAIYLSASSSTPNHESTKFDSSFHPMVSSCYAEDETSALPGRQGIAINCESYASP